MANRGQIPRLLRTVFADADLVQFGLVVEKNARGEEILSETAGLNPNYIRLLMAGAPRTQSETDPKTLLYLVLRHAALLEHFRAGLHVLRERGLAGELEVYEREFVNISAQSETLFDLMDRRIPGLTGTRTLAEHLARPFVSPATPAEQMIAEYLAALRTLEPLPTAELERLFTETLDVCAYRLDAWTTSLATQRLQAMRKTRPRDSYVGAYGWVENLKPAPDDERQEVPIEGEPGVSSNTFNGGYVYAPSMAHGAAAAVLRNGYMTRAGAQQSPYAIDLSSARVRVALSLLDAVREGQPLGASLGYLFERGLHDAGLDQFIDDFRNKYRLVTSSTAPSTEPAESIAARNVVDGYALLQDYRKPGAFHWGGLTLPASDVMGRVNRELAKVNDALDALTDLLTAESVFQMVGGNTTGAGATLDAMAKGARAPEPKIAERTRGGTGVTHRVALILGGAAEADSPWPVAPLTPRSEVEPRLNAWVGQILGNPASVICFVQFGNGERIRVTLSDLRLQPLDILTLARGEGPITGGDSELDWRVTFAATQQAAAGATQPVIHYEVSPDNLAPAAYTFPEILEVARSINELLGRARPLRPSDLMPEPASDVVGAGADLRLVELQGRADSAVGRLGAVITDLAAVTPVASAVSAAPNVGGMRRALREASLFGVAGAFPPPSDTGLEIMAQSVLSELWDRMNRAADADDPASAMREIFGRDFVFLPRFSPAITGELAQTLLHTPNLGADPEGTLSAWFAKAAQVRPSLGAWRMISLYAGSLGRPPAAPRIAQFPFDSNARWVGLPFHPPASERPRAGQVSVMLLGGALPAADAAWTGILIDEWVELIPNQAEDAGVVFHYDRPNAEAPQAVLIAVPPDSSQPWSLELLLSTIEQTLETVKTRGFDGEWRHSTGELDHALYNGPWLPLIFMADGDPDTTVASSFGPAVQGGGTP